MGWYLLVMVGIVVGSHINILMLIVQLILFQIQQTLKQPFHTSTLPSVAAQRLPRGLAPLRPAPIPAFPQIPKSMEFRGRGNLSLEGLRPSKTPLYQAGSLRAEGEAISSQARD